MVRTPTTPAQTPLRNGTRHTNDTQPTPSQHPRPQPTPTGYVQHSHLTVDHIGRLLLLPCQRLVRRLHGISHGGQVGLGLGELVHSLKALLLPAPPHLSDVLGLRLTVM